MHIRQTSLLTQIYNARGYLSLEDIHLRERSTRTWPDSLYCSTWQYGIEDKDPAGRQAFFHTRNRIDTAVIWTHTRLQFKPYSTQRNYF